MVNNQTRKKPSSVHIFNMWSLVVRLIHIKFEPNSKRYSAKWCIFVICFWIIAAVVLGASHGRAQVPAGEGQVSVPSSSTEQPGDTGVRGHTNVQIFIPKTAEDDARAPLGGGGATSRAPPAPGPEGAGGSARPQWSLAKPGSGNRDVRPLGRFPRHRHRRCLSLSDSNARSSGLLEPVWVAGSYLRKLLGCLCQRLATPGD
jgi:hypothetical protein